MKHKFKSVLCNEQLIDLQNKICKNPNLMTRANNSYVINCVEGFIPEADSVLDTIEKLVYTVYPGLLKYSNSFLMPHRQLIMLLWIYYI
jgi:hypothetical protein